MFYFRVFELLRYFIIGLANTRTNFSNRNRVFYNRVFVHFNSRDESLSQTFCFIPGNRVDPVVGHRNCEMKKVDIK